MPQPIEFFFDFSSPYGYLASRVIDAASFKSKSKNSPFDTRPVAGAVVMTVVDGRIVHKS